MANRSKRPVCVALWYRAGQTEREGFDRLSLSANLPPLKACELLESLLKSLRYRLEALPSKKPHTHTNIGQIDGFRKMAAVFKASSKFFKRTKEKRALYHIFSFQIQTFIQKHSPNAQKMFAPPAQCSPKLLNRENRFRICICKQSSARTANPVVSFRKWNCFHS